MEKFYNWLWDKTITIRNDVDKLSDYLQFVTPLGFLLWVACFGTNHTARVFIVCYAIANIIAYIVKILFNNPRPHEVDGATNPDLNLDWSIKEGNSFPSGHTMSAMAGSVFWFEITPFVGIFGILIGLSTGISRVVAKAHWLRDIIASSVISAIIYIAAKLFFL